MSSSHRDQAKERSPTLKRRPPVRKDQSASRTSPSRQPSGPRTDPESVEASRNVLLKAAKWTPPGTASAETFQVKPSNKAAKKLEALKNRLRQHEQEFQGLKQEIAEITGAYGNTSDNIEELNEAGEVEISSDGILRRKYRKRAELPDPTLPANAEVNRPTTQVKLRLDPAIAAVIDEAVAQSASGSRTEWIVEAALARIEREQPDLYTQLKQTSLPEPI